MILRGKLKFLNKPKDGHYPKGLVHGFCPKKSDFLLSLFFTDNMSEKIVFQYFK